MKNEQESGRRKFVKTMASGTLVAALGVEGLAQLLQSCSSPKQATASGGDSPAKFIQQPLPYAYSALEPAIDAQTMEIHYSKHAAGYSKNLMDAVEAEKVGKSVSLESLLQKISAYSPKMRNNAGGHYNHEMFWQCMRPKTEDNKPSGKLLLAIEAHSGSFAQFKSSFADAAKSRFGSGWAWLTKDALGNLKMGSTANQDNPLMDLKSVEISGTPLLCLDVWEHAYYLKYQQKRADYIDNWWTIVNWDYVQMRYEKI